MPAPAVATADEAIRESYRDLRALRVAADAGWCTYVAGDLPVWTHVVAVTPAPGSRRAPAPVYRTLTRGEPYWWALGLADAHGAGETVLQLEREKLPQLVAVAEAAAMLPAKDRWGTVSDEAMTVDGVTYNINGGRLYPVYGLGRARLLFADQIAAEQATRAGTTTKAGEEKALRARQKWMRLRARFPPDMRLHALDFDVTPVPSPDPLPIRTSLSDDRRRTQALIIGERNRWFQFQYLDNDQFVVMVGRQKRTLPGAGVLPWVLGMADFRGESVKIAYREDLG